MKISVIIPTLNEASCIAECLIPLQSLRAKGAEVILVDGGSEDETLSIARPYCDQQLVSSPGRAIQLNRGWRSSKGRLLLFLHADCIFGPEHLSAVGSLSDGPCWGFFRSKIDGDGLAYRVIERLINIRCAVTHVAGGDQGIFVSRDLLQSIDGFPELDLMEDVALCRRLKRIRKPVCLNTFLSTSSRRWQNHGLIKTVLLMWGLRISYYLGVNPARLARWYRHAR